MGTSQCHEVLPSAQAAHTKLRRDLRDPMTGDLLPKLLCLPGLR